MAMIKNRIYSHLKIFVIIYLSSCQPAEKVDLIVRNAQVITVNEAFEKAEAFAVKDGKFIAVGAEHEILNKYTATQVYDAKKAFIYPGFVDPHSHFMGYGIELQRLDLVGSKSFDEVISRIREHIEKTNQKWVLGRGWDQNDWDKKEFPVTDTLAQLFPDNYIALKRIDGHAYMVSPNVLALANIKADVQIQGGQVVVDNSGKPTGILIDEAMKSIDIVIPQPDERLKIRGLLMAQENLLAAGLTAVCDAGLAAEDISLINKLQPDSIMIRVYAMYAASKDIYKNTSDIGYKTDHLTAKSIKLYADGALGSRGAYLKAPYSDAPENRGLLIAGPDSVYSWAKWCYQNGFQLNVHCIGDAANQMVLQEMGSVLKGNNDRRWRIEHAQVVSPEDRELFGKFNIIPSVQPTHAISDMTWAETRLGERIAHAYSLKGLLSQNGMIPLGTDFPVEDISPLGTFYTAIARRNASWEPSEGFLFEEALTREEALKGITIWAAMANFDEMKYGSIEVGKFADFVVLNRDLLSCEESEIMNAQILSTWIQGVKRYEK